MEQQVGIGWVIATWLLLVGYIAWDLRQVRQNARREIDRAMDRRTPPEARQEARKRILHDFDQFHRDRGQPLWWRWSRSMMRPGNLVFGLLLGVALIFTALWIGGGTVAEGLNYGATLCLALVLLTGVAWVVRRVF